MTIDDRAKPGTVQPSFHPDDMTAACSDHEAARGGYAVPLGVVDVYVLYAVAWISSAAATGIVGNLAYAAIQRLLERSKDKSVPGHLHAAGSQVRIDEVKLVARLALQARCGELGLPVPTTLSLTIRSMTRDTTVSTVWHVVIDGSDLRAEVILATGGLWQQQIPVAIWTVTPDSQR